MKPRQATGQECNWGISCPACHFTVDYARTAPPAEPAVEKRDGSEEDFDAEKIRKAVQKAAIDADVFDDAEERNTYAADVAHDIRRWAREKDAVSTKDIRERVLATLGNTDPRLRKAWHDHEAQCKRPAQLNLGQRD